MTLFNADLPKDKMGKMLEFFNWLYSDFDTYITSWYGFKGEHWDMIDGIPTLLGKYASDPSARNDIGAYTNVAGVIEPLKFQGPVRGHLVEWAQSEHFDSPGVGMWTKLPTATGSTAMYLPDLQKLHKETYINIITGKLPLDAFDKLVTDWYAQGGKTLEDEATAWYQDFVSK
jgi:hypothetical protein